MGNGNFVQTTFLGGEWSPLAQGRMEDPRYKSAMNVCLNSYPIEEGAWTRRPGLHRIGPTRDGQPAKLLSFDVSEALPADLELTAGHLRVISGQQIIADSTNSITNISSATPAVFTGDVTRWASGDQVIFELGDAATKAACATLNGRTFGILPLTTSTFTVFDEVTNEAVGGADITWVSTYLVTAKRILDLATPYDADQIGQVRLVQSEADAVLLHGDVQPQIVTESSLDPDTGTGEFEVNPATFIDGPYLDAFTGSLAAPSGTTGIISVTLGFTAWSATTAYKKGDYVSRVGIGYKAIADVNVNIQPPNAAYWEVVGFGDPVGPNGFTATDIGRSVRLFSAGTTWTWGRITSLSSTGLVDASAAGVSEIGNMTDGAPISELFDGDFSKNSSDCATYSTTGSDAKAWGGLKINALSTVTAAILYPSSSGTWANGGREERISFSLYAKNGAAPTAWNDGTELAHQERPASSDPVTLTSSDSATSYKFIWAVIRWDAPPSAPSGIRLWSSQFQFFDNTGSPGGAANVEILGGDLASTASCVWRLGAYSNTSGWPKTGCYYEGRLWLGGAIDNRFDGSKSNDPYNFAPTAAAGTVGDSNAISYTLNAKDVNPIFWMEPNQQGLIMGTQGGEWLVQASAANNPLTPTSIQAHRSTRYRCANTEPVVVGLSTVFVQQARRNLLEYISDVFSGKFFAPNLSELARHMTKTGVEEICAQDGLTPIIWCRRTDGALIGATYRRVSMHSSEPPKFLGWHRHELGSECDVTSIAKAPVSTGLSDGLSVVVRDNATGLYHIETMGPFFDEDNVIGEAAFLDSAIVPACGTVVSTNVRFDGLWLLEGKSVDVFAAGIDCGAFTVVNGSVSVPLATLPLARMNTISTDGNDYGDLAVSIDTDRFTIPVVVGHTYSSRGQLLRPYKQEDTGARAGVAFGKTRRSHRYGILLHKTQGLSVGTDFDNLKPALFRTPGSAVYENYELFSGHHEGTMDDQYSTDSMLAWEITRPYPATVLAAGTFLQTQDK